MNSPMNGSMMPQSSMAASLASAPNPVLIKIRDVVYQVAGIFHPDNKHRLLEDRCSRRMQALGVKNLRDYYDCLTAKPTRHAEMVALLNEITIGETCFFRNLPQLEAIRNTVIPRILSAPGRPPQRRLRLWSAGCSTGEEPYTLSMVLLEEQKKRGNSWSFEILATDLNERSLARAGQGAYDNYSIRNTPDRFKPYFLARNGEFHVLPEVKAKVEFRQVNLSDPARMSSLKEIDIILCCNVLIYFDTSSKQRVIGHFQESLQPQGYLFLGHAESLYGVCEDFRLVHLPGCTAYIKPSQPSPMILPAAQAAAMPKVRP